MNRIFLLLGVMFIYIVMQFYSAGRYVESATRDRMKYAINYAAHDAAMQIDPDQLTEGYIVFRQDQALDVFKETLADNLNLDFNLAPGEDSYIQGPIEIVYEEYIDDASGVSFPINYRNDTYKIYQTIEGPSVIYKIRVPNPKVSTLSSDGYIYVHTIQEYPVP